MFEGADLKYKIPQNPNNNKNKQKKQPSKKIHTHPSPTNLSHLSMNLAVF